MEPLSKLTEIEQKEIKRRAEVLHIQRGIINIHEMIFGIKPKIDYCFSKNGDYDNEGNINSGLDWEELKL